MITRRLIPTIIACSALLAIAAVAGAEKTRTTEQLDQVKRATARFKDVSKAEAAGYVRAGECTKSGSGAMGVHYINGKLLGDPRLDIRKPEVLLYEPQRNGSMKLVGVEYFVLDNGQRAPRILGQRFDGPMTHGGTAPSHYDLHVWTVRRNPRGVFAQYNPRVSCAADSEATAAAVSKPRVAKFLAYVSGKQTTTWNVPRHGVGSNCQGQRYLEAGGTETVRFSSKPTKIIVWSHRGYGPFVKYGTWKFLSESASGMATSGRVARTGSMKYTLDPGVCHDAGDPTTEDTGPYDCGEKTFATWAKIGWVGTDVYIGLDSPGVRYANCPLLHHDRVFEADLSEAGQRYPKQAVFDRSQGLIEVRGSKTYRAKVHRDYGTSTTTVNWKLRLRRVK